MNIFLLLKYYLPQLQGAGNIIEFGSYQGGSAIFIAAVCLELDLPFNVYGLDTFAGMPHTDPAVDAHRGGDFGNVGFEELTSFVKRQSMSNLHFVRGMFEETGPNLLPRIAPIAVAHIDCDIRSAVAASYEMVKPYMVPGGYLIFDDCHVSSCLGATEAVEDLLVRRDGMNAEQVWPHWLFRMGL
jgi:cephalosporin hydroxylase